MVRGAQEEITQGWDLVLRLSTLGFYEVPKIPSADGMVFICLVTIIKEDRERTRKATTVGWAAGVDFVISCLFHCYNSCLGHLILCDK